MISVKALAEELGKTVEEIDVVRGSKLSTKHWTRRGKGISLSDEGADIIRGHFDIPEAFPSKHRAFVKAEARNPSWVWCVLDGMEGRFPVAIPRRLRGKLVGKYITVDAITDINGTTFRHEALGQ